MAEPLSPAAVDRVFASTRFDILGTKVTAIKIPKPRPQPKPMPRSPKHSTNVIRIELAGDGSAAVCVEAESAEQAKFLLSEAAYSVSAIAKHAAEMAGADKQPS
jgi:hypothetical protein